MGKVTKQPVYNLLGGLDKLRRSHLDGLPVLDGATLSGVLSRRSIDHVVLERGEVANSWRTERWDSLRLLTPNWQSRLPGYRYDGPDPVVALRARDPPFPVEDIPASGRLRGFAGRHPGPRHDREPRSGRGVAAGRPVETGVDRHRVEQVAPHPHVEPLAGEEVAPRMRADLRQDER